MSYEEAETEVQIERRMKLNFFQRHEDMLRIYIAFFTGMILSLSILIFNFNNQEEIERALKQNFFYLKGATGSTSRTTFIINGYSQIQQIIKENPGVPWGSIKLEVGNNYDGLVEEDIHIRTINGELWFLPPRSGSVHKM
jgi:hypothetical protein